MERPSVWDAIEDPIFLATVSPSATPIWKTMFIPGLVYFKPTHALGHSQRVIRLNLHLMSGFA